MSPDASNEGLNTPVVGRWSKRKYHFLDRYLTLFSTGMKKKWSTLHYIDLFAGAGQVQIRGTTELVDGSPLLAAGAKDPFAALHLCEQDEDKAAALEARLKHRGITSYRLLCGDANVLIDELLAPVRRADGLAVTFADPYGLHLDFDTVRAVSKIRSDLIVLLADNMDALRNWATYYLNNPTSNLDKFMGEGGWREQLLNANSDKHASLIRDRYRSRLESLGYSHFGWERVQYERGTDIYTLLYATKNERGLDFWNKASQVDEGGQRSFDFH